MTILETAILHQGKILTQVQFYQSEEFLQFEHRNDLLNAVYGLVTSAFKDSIQNFTIGDKTILFKTKELEIYEDEDQKKEESPAARQRDIGSENTLIIYCIVEKGTSFKPVEKSMNDALVQFLDRFSVYDIKNLEQKKFQKFEKRLEKIFADLALKFEDRFKNIF